MKDQLKVALIQSEIVWQNAEKNLQNYSRKINALKETVDLIVLPEMFATGFSMEPASIAETMNGESVIWMQQIAAEKKVAVAGSLIITEDGKFYNRFVFVHPSGQIDAYDKRHLFTLAGEHNVYKTGIEKLIVNYEGWKICPLICYDLRFPVWARNVETYDLLIYVANWPKPRINAWDTLLKARAIENMCHVIGVNRVGEDGNDLQYIGHSAAYDGLGGSLSEIQSGKEATIIAVLDKKHTIDIRKKLNFLNDQDSFTINY